MARHGLTSPLAKGYVQNHVDVWVRNEGRIIEPTGFDNLRENRGGTLDCTAARSACGAGDSRTRRPGAGRFCKRTTFWTSELGGGTAAGTRTKGLPPAGCGRAQAKLRPGSGSQRQSEPTPCRAATFRTSTMMPMPRCRILILIVAYTNSPAKRPRPWGRAGECHGARSGQGTRAVARAASGFIP